MKTKKMTALCVGLLLSTISVPVSANVLEDNGTTVTTDDGYVLSESNERVYDDSEVDELSDWALTMARNEIYARHGRKFYDSNLQKYFSSCSWYSGTIDSGTFNANEASYLSDTEMKNVEMIYEMQGCPELVNGETTSAQAAATNTTPTSTPAAANTSSGTTGQSNALEKAKQYLEYIAFSYNGLIKQLQYDGFSSEECTYGADNCGADWREQAQKKAADYLDVSAFSYSGLVGQLEYDEFSNEDASYAATNCGADWNEQAVKKAQDYLSISSFSRDSLIGQLEYDGFSTEQAAYAASAVGF